MDVRRFSNDGRCVELCDVRDGDAALEMAVMMYLSVVVAMGASTAGLKRSRTSIARLSDIGGVGD